MTCYREKIAFDLLLLGLFLRKDMKIKIHRSIFFYMSVTLGLAYNREEHGWGFLENMVLRRKIGPKREQLKMI